MEETAPGSVIGSVRHHGGETSQDGEVTYTVIGGTDSDGTFVVDRLTGDVFLARPLDYEQHSHYTLQIEVDDLSQATLSSTLVHLGIDVEDSNDHAPQFPEDPITIVISESTEPNSSVYTFQAMDKDGSEPNSQVTYSIQHQWPNTHGLLSLDSSTGVLSIAQELDHEVAPSLLLVVKATDSARDASQRRWGSVTARVYITDENDNPPVFRSPASVSVMEDQPVGFVALYVMATDADEGENGRVTYRIQSGNTGGKFSLNSNTGKSKCAVVTLLVLLPTKILNLVLHNMNTSLHFFESFYVSFYISIFRTCVLIIFHIRTMPEFFLSICSSPKFKFTCT